MLDQVVGRDQDPALARPRRPCPRGCARAGAAPAASRSRSSSVSPSRSGRVTFACAPQARNADETVRSACTTSSGDAVAQHHAARELVVAGGVLGEVLGEAGELVDRRDLGAGVADDDVHQAEVVDVLVGEHHQLDVVDRVPVLGELVLELVQRAAGVRARSRPASAGRPRSGRC